jgi:hypothetical protein
VGTMSTDDDLVARTAAHLESVGFVLIPLAQPVAGVWDLLAVSPRGLTVVAPRRETPNLIGTTYGALPGFPPSTVRLVLVCGAGPLPTATTL